MGLVGQFVGVESDSGSHTAMTLRIERVDPSAFADSASLILQEAFQPPTICNTPNYLRGKSR
jgi:hypothetical protein